MRFILKTFSAFVLLTFFWLNSRADENVEMADTWHSNGKIYVVIAVLAIIFLGIVIYLISIDRKLSRMEKTTTSKS